MRLRASGWVRARRDRALELRAKWGTMGSMRVPALLAAAALTLFALPTWADEEIATGSPAPGFHLKTLNPDVAKLPWVSLDHYVGPDAEDPDAKAVLLSFFASWCGPCKKEMPYLEELNQKFKEQGLRVLSVDIDKEPAGIEQAKSLATTSKVTYPVLSDRFNFLARRYLGEKSPLPSVFIILRDGNIARIEKGYGKDASSFLLAEVKKALAPPAPQGK